MADYGVVETPLLMQIEYEEVDGFLLPTKRKYKKSTWNADVTDQPWVDVTWSNIKFNTNLSKQVFEKENMSYGDYEEHMKGVGFDPQFLIDQEVARQDELRIDNNVA